MWRRGQRGVAYAHSVAQDIAQREVQRWNIGCSGEDPLSCGEERERLGSKGGQRREGEREKDGGRGKREGEEEREGRRKGEKGTCRRKGGGREEKEEEESMWFVTKTTLSSQDVLHNVIKITRHHVKTHD